MTESRNSEKMSNGNRRTGLIISIVSIVLVICVAGAACFYAFFGGSFSNVMDWIAGRSGAVQDSSPTTATSQFVPADSDSTFFDNAMKYELTYGTGPERINLWAFTKEVPDMVGQYVKRNPEFGEKYLVEVTLIATDEGNYETALDNALVAGGDMAPDIYVVDESFVCKYTKGEMAKFAATYEELGINVDAKLKEAEIAQYSIDLGSRNGEIVALGYQSTSCAMIYNAGIAKAVFGTEDPYEIELITGAGTGKWDKFFEAAERLKENGYAAVSGPEDIWNACVHSADTPWVVDGKLNIDSKREKYFDLAKKLEDNGYSNNTKNWHEGWYLDMQGKGERKVFAFFGPAWLINYVMAGNFGGSLPGEGTYGQWRVCAPPVGFYWGGSWILATKYTRQKEGVAELIEWITLDTSETGLQYLIANGLLDWDNDPATDSFKDVVASAKVMMISDGTSEFCGGQDIFPVFIQGNSFSSGKAASEYDAFINSYFLDAADKYVKGMIEKDEAIKQFKKNVEESVSY